MRNCSGSYELDVGAASALGARRLRLLQRGAAIVGRCGRRGVISGSARDLHVSAMVTDAERVVALDLTFDEAFGTFVGTYRLDARAMPVRGRRTERKRPAS